DRGRGGVARDELAAVPPRRVDVAVEGRVVAIEEVLVVVAAEAQARLEAELGAGRREPGERRRGGPGLLVLVVRRVGRGVEGAGAEVADGEADVGAEGAPGQAGVRGEAGLDRLVVGPLAVAVGSAGLGAHTERVVTPGHPRRRADPERSEGAAVQGDAEVVTTAGD